MKSNTPHPPRTLLPPSPEALSLPLCAMEAPSHPLLALATAQAGRSPLRPKCGLARGCRVFPFVLPLLSGSWPPCLAVSGAICPLPGLRKGWTLLVPAQGHLCLFPGVTVALAWVGSSSVPPSSYPATWCHLLLPSAWGSGLGSDFLCVALRSPRPVPSSDLTSTKAG